MKQTEKFVEYEGWLDFIIRNFKSGRVTDIASHIENEANKQGYGSKNKNIQAKVRQILPESTHNGPSKTRVKNRDIFWYDKSDKTYHLKSKMNKFVELSLDNTKEVKTSKGSGETISITTPKDKSKKHNDLLKIITDYAREMGFDAQPEKDNIDLLMKKDDKYIINEVKTYKNSIYVAVGQVQYYKYKLMNLYPKQTSLGVATLNIVGDFELPKKFEGFLKSLNINYLNVNEFKNTLKL